MSDRRIQAGMRAATRAIRRICARAFFILAFALAFTAGFPTDADASRNARAASTASTDYDREIAKQKRELEDMRIRLEKGQREVEQLKAKQSSALTAIDRLAGSIALTDAYLRKLETTETWLDQASRESEKELSALSRRISDRNALMAKRVRALYVAGGPEKMLLLPAQEDGSGDFFERVYFMRRILRYDASLVKLSRDDQQRKRKALAKLRDQQNELRSFRDLKAREKTRFARARLEQERALNDLQSDLMAKDRALKELEENARLLTEILRGLEKRRKEELARNKKVRTLETGTQYCLPVQGPIVSKYGMQYHATLKTSTRNLGIEIEGAGGAAVRAAVSGEVALITRIPGYGQGIILDNGSGIFTIYANLSGIRVGTGDKVKTCQDIAEVASTPGRVYFEVRQGTKTLDPALWLQAK
jgi:septal ring factor EnvC (AmiA/AmiB activator)